MTNKEWLQTLSNEDLAYLLISGMREYSGGSTQSLSVVEEWLDKEHTDQDPVYKYYMKYGPKVRFMQIEGEWKEVFIDLTGEISGD